MILLGVSELIYYGAEFFAAPIIGATADRFGRKPMLVLSLAGTAVSYVLLALAIAGGLVGLFLFARFVDGATGGNQTVSEAAVADVVREDDRARVFGWFSAAFSLGFVIGPLLGGYLATSGIPPAVPFFAVAVMAVGNVAFVIARFEETRKGEAKGEPIRPFAALARAREAAGDRKFRGLFGTILLFGAGFSFFTSQFNVFLAGPVGFDPRTVGWTFSAMGICFFLVEIVGIDLFKRAFGSHGTLRLAIPATAICFVALSLVRAPWALWLWLPFFALSLSLVRPNLSALVSERAGDEQGRILGVAASVQSLAWGVPPIVAGGMAAVFGPPAAIFLGGGLVLASALWFRRTVPE